MTEPKFSLSRETLEQLEMLLEDTISFMCDEHEVSSELAWIVTEVFAIKKQAQLEQLTKAMS